MNNTSNEFKTLRRLLLVEDASDARRSMCILLKNAGFHVDEAVDGVEALELVLRMKAASKLPELLVVDIRMPRMNGVELLSALDEQEIRLPTLAITGYGSKEVLADLLRFGCVGYLDKPFSPDELLDGIKTVIARHGLNDQDGVAPAMHTGGVAHDLKNILHVVGGNLELLRPLLLEQPQALELMDSAAEATVRAVNLCRQLVMVARGAMSVRRTLDLAGVVRKAFDMVGDWRGIECDMRLPTGLWRVSADEAELVRAVQNLLFNARDAMPQGGRLTVCAENMLPDSTLRLSGMPAHVHLTISDTGGGIPDEQRARLGEPGFSTKALGTGMGVYVTREIISRYGGRMVFSTDNSQGVVIDIFLPSVGAGTASAASSCDVSS